MAETTTTNRYVDYEGVKKLRSLMDETYATKANFNALTTTVNGKVTKDATYTNLVSTVNDIPNIYATKTSLDALSQQVRDRSESNIRVYGIKFDKATSICERLWDAAGITTDTSNFCYQGTVKDIDNPFDGLYPWMKFRQCNVDLNKYRALKAGEDIRNCVIAWYGDPDFVTNDPTKFVGRYRPEYWFTGYDSGDYQIYAVATGYMEGWGYSPACIDSYSLLCDDGSNPTGTTGTLTCYNGQPMTNITLQSIHNRAKSTGFTLQNIYTHSAITTAYVVEYANMNVENTIGNGIDDLYAQDKNFKPLIAETNATRVVLPKSNVNVDAIMGATLDFSTSTTGGVILSNRRTCLGYENYSADNNYISVLFDSPLTIQTTMNVSIHGAVNDPASYGSTTSSTGNASGYIGTNKKSAAFYRGATFYSNRYFYVLGAYRHTGTEEIWICPDIYKCDNYDALNETDHINTGLVLPRDSTDSHGRWIKTLHTANSYGLGAVPFCATTGGSSTAPVGDYHYMPATSAGNTILLVGGDASDGSFCGPFYGSWRYGSGSSSWSYGGGAVLFAKNTEN